MIPTVYLKNRRKIKAYIQKSWGHQPVLIQLLNEVYGNSLFCVERYDIAVFEKNLSSVDGGLALLSVGDGVTYGHVESITMSRKTYYKLIDYLETGGNKINPTMTVVNFLERITSRAEILDEILSEL